MCRVIAVSNQKGGVGKTVSCVNLGIGLAQEGKKVLMIDADPQGSLTISLGYEEPDEMEYSLATLMMNIVNDEKLNIEKTILHHKEGVDLIPANIELSAIEVSLVNAMSRELILRSMVDRLREFYDYIIIDCILDGGDEQEKSQMLQEKDTVSLEIKEYISRQEAAELAGVSVSTVTKWMQSGEFQCVGAGKVLRVYRQQFLNWLNEHREGVI
mgnify:CR=1 FL=1